MKTGDINNKNDPQNKHHLGTVSKNIFTGGLKLVLLCQPHTKFRCGLLHIDVWFSLKIPNLSINYPLKNINQDIKRR